MALPMVLVYISMSLATVPIFPAPAGLYPMKNLEAERAVTVILVVGLEVRTSCLAPKLMAVPETVPIITPELLLLP